MRILITGSTGLLGQALRARLDAVHEVWGFSRHIGAAPRQISGDVTDREAVQRAVERIQPHLILHAAAQSDVDRCELEPETARAVHVEATRRLVEAAQRAKARFVYISTDYVFDGLKGSPYTEDDLPHPVSVYAHTKWDGERVVQDSGLSWLIVRPSTLFGPGRAAFVDRAIQQAEQGVPVTVFADQTTSPSYTVDVAEGLARLLDARAEGIVHLANSGAARRDEFVETALKRWGVNAIIRKVRLADARLPARRPPNSSLAVSRLTAITGWSPPSWQAALEQHLAWKKRSTPCSSAS